jgi:hypothetical protein
MYVVTNDWPIKLEGRGSIPGENSFLLSHCMHIGSRGLSNPPPLHWRPVPLSPRHEADHLALRVKGWCWQLFLRSTLLNIFRHTNAGGRHGLPSVRSVVQKNVLWRYNQPASVLVEVVWCWGRSHRCYWFPRQTKSSARISNSRSGFMVRSISFMYGHELILMGQFQFGPNICALIVIWLWQR